MKDRELSFSVFLCGKDGTWERDLEELLQLNQVVTLLSIGDVKYDILKPSQSTPKHPDTRVAHQIITKKEKIGLTPKQTIKLNDLNEFERLKVYAILSYNLSLFRRRSFFLDL